MILKLRVGEADSDGAASHYSASAVDRYGSCVDGVETPFIVLARKTGRAFTRTYFACARGKSAGTHTVVVPARSGLLQNHVYSLHIFLFPFYNAQFCEGAREEKKKKINKIKVRSPLFLFAS